MNDPDVHKGAIEGDRPTDEQNVSNNGEGVDQNGLPNDPVATARTKSARTRTRRRGEQSQHGEFANCEI